MSLRDHWEPQHPPTEPWRLIPTLETTCRLEPLLLLYRRLNDASSFLKPWEVLLLVLNIADEFQSLDLTVRGGSWTSAQRSENLGCFRWPSSECFPILVGCGCTMASRVNSRNAQKVKSVVN